jgi:predicted metalloprotease with PDZ domain
MITESGGGLEHKNSTMLMTNRWSTRTRRAYVGWLELASHEYFHAWNVKRLRPAELGPFDYENENITRSPVDRGRLHRLLRGPAGAAGGAADAR